jgi:pimeloyl-ACP methyl ester carboxylesterase
LNSFPFSGIVYKCTPHTDKSLARITIPVLIICGDQEIYFPKEYYQELAGLIKGSTLKMYTGKGHMNTLESKAFVKDMFDFIGKGS